MRELLLPVALVLAFATPAVADPAGRLVQVVGTVELNGKKAAKGDVVNEGDRLKVGHASRVMVACPSGSAFRLGPGSDLVLSQVGAHTRLDLKDGDLLCAAKHGSDLQVRAPKLVAAVRGTVFYLQHSKLHPSYVCICNGSLRVHAPGKGSRTLQAEHHKAYAVFEDKRWIPLPMTGHHDDEMLRVRDLAGR